jgi:hypothetical protein
MERVDEVSHKSLKQHDLKKRSALQRADASTEDRDDDAEPVSNRPVAPSSPKPNSMKVALPYMYALMQVIAQPGAESSAAWEQRISAEDADPRKDLAQKLFERIVKEEARDTMTVSQFHSEVRLILSRAPSQRLLKNGDQMVVEDRDLRDHPAAWKFLLREWVVDRTKSKDTWLKGVI